nr:type VII secretion target [Amycolatopsis umgeniensis]
MSPGETTGQLNRLRAAGDDLEPAWLAQRGKIDAPGQIGGGPLGRAFTALYSAPRTAVAGAMDQIPGIYRQLADNGGQAVQAYEATDRAAAGQYDR